MNAQWWREWKGWAAGINPKAPPVNPAEIWCLAGLASEGRSDESIHHHQIVGKSPSRFFETPR